jgi:hypothetical protein
LKLNLESSSRKAHLPFDHLLAEVATAPLVSEQAFRSGLPRLDPLADGQTGRLWRRIENEIVGAFPGVALDELVSIRDATWYADPSDLSMGSHLFRTADRWLEVRGSSIWPKEPTDMGTQAGPRLPIARRALFWLTVAIPQDLLFASLDSPGKPPLTVDQISPDVARLLADNLFSENHVHLGAAYSFGELWSLVVSNLSQIGSAQMEAPGGTFDDGIDLHAWLQRAGIARIVLAGYLVDDTKESLSNYVRGTVREAMCKNGSASLAALIEQALDDIGSGTLTRDVSAAALGGAYRTLCGQFATRGWNSIEESFENDPIWTFFRPDIGVDPERVFLAQGIQALRGSSGIPALVDPAFETLFWQYVRVRNIFFRHVTQRPLTPGLQWFIRFYKRMSTARGDLASSRFLLSTASRTSGFGKGLKSLEVRTSPSPDVDEMLQFVQNVSNWDEGPEEVGVVYHFPKSRSRGSDRGQPQPHGRNSTADPRAKENGGIRYRDYQAKQMRSALALATLVERFPLTQGIFRGLDVCSDETSVPAWVMKPLLDTVRSAALRGDVYLRSVRREGFPPIRTTAHVGEDFRHLLTGIRNIDEAIEVFGLREGDRLGHAIALGIEPAEWAGRAGRIAMSVEERIFDLAWERDWCARNSLSGVDGRIGFIENELRLLGEDWLHGDKGSDPVNGDVISKLRADLAGIGELAQTGVSSSWNEASDPQSKILELYLSDPEVFRRGQRMIWIDPKNEIESIHALQAALRRKVSDLGLTVEINPSSNLLVGDLSDLRNHPLWRLRPPIQDPGLPAVAICLGTDDPLIVNSTLPGEFQLLHDALILAGLSAPQATDWLDGVRKTGLSSRFTLPKLRVDLTSVRSQA